MYHNYSWNEVRLNLVFPSTAGMMFEALLLITAAVRFPQNTVEFNFGAVFPITAEIRLVAHTT